MWRSFKLKGSSTVHVSMCPKLNCHLPCVWTLELTMYVLYIFAPYFYLRIGTEYLYLSFTQRSRAFYCRLLAWGTSNPSHGPKSTDRSIIILCTHSPRKKIFKGSKRTYIRSRNRSHPRERIEERTLPRVPYHPFIRYLLA